MKQVAEWKRVLSFYREDRWRVRLVGGGEFFIYAGAYEERADGITEFSTLIDGTPPEFMTILEIATHLIKTIRTDSAGMMSPEDT